MRVPFVHLEGRAAATAAAGRAGFSRPALPRVRVRALPLIRPGTRHSRTLAPRSSFLRASERLFVFLSCAPRALLTSLKHDPVAEFCSRALQNKNKPE